MITLTFAGDESGDVSFAFDKGASRYFVVAVIATSEPDRLRGALDDVRRKSGLPARYEFSFHSLSSARLRRSVFQKLAESDFESWAVMVDKTTLSEPFTLMNKMDFYLYFVTELIRLIPENKTKDALLILDEFDTAAQLPVELRRFLRARKIPGRFKQVVARRSSSEPLIQVADLIAGAIARHNAKDDPGAYSTIAGKVKRLLEFRD